MLLEPDSNPCATSFDSGVSVAGKELVVGIGEDLSKLFSLSHSLASAVRTPFNNNPAIAA